MQYHEPDPVWEAFGITSYEHYLEAVSLPPRFHAAVHEDVLRSYELAQRMMVYAWYHYPLYDEAFSKLLRTVEMAVKLRCGPLGIPLESTGKKNRVDKKRLSDLMKELSAAEAAKEIGNDLDKLRNIRNHYMHPDRHFQSGIIVKQLILHIHNLLNKIFLPIPHFEQSGVAVSEMTRQINELGTGILILEKAGQYYPLTGQEIVGAVQVEDKWIYCMVCHLLMNDIEKRIERAEPGMVYPVWLSDVSVANGVISGRNLRNGQDNQLLNSDDNSIATLVDAYHQKLESIAHQGKMFLFGGLIGQLAEIRGRFEYEYLWRV